MSKYGDLYLQEILRPGEQPGQGVWRVRIHIPKKLQPALGKNLTRFLGTRNKAEAKRLAEPVIDEFLPRIDAVWDGMMPEKLVIEGSKLVKVKASDPRPDAVAAADDDEIAEFLLPPSATRMQPRNTGPDYVSLIDMVDRWAADGHKKSGVTSTTEHQNWKTKAKRFADWLGHEDMTRVSRRQAHDYIHSLDGSLSDNSINNHLKALRRIFSYAISKDFDDVMKGNPFDGIEYKKVEDEVSRKAGFTEEERRLILTLSRDATPEVKWLHWCGAFMGVRVGEVADAHTCHIGQEQGIWYLQLTEEGRDEEATLKTEQSFRLIPLHSSLIREGFLDYVAGLPEGPLFPGLRVMASTGDRATHGSKEANKFLRSIGITGANKVHHCHRHTATSFLRNALTDKEEPAVKDDIEHYLLGHGFADVHGHYGKTHIQPLKAAIELIPDPTIE